MLARYFYLENPPHSSSPGLIEGLELGPGVFLGLFSSLVDCLDGFPRFNELLFDSLELMLEMVVPDQPGILAVVV